MEIKLRTVPSFINQTMNLDRGSFNPLWVHDPKTSILGLGYSFYLEYIEFFCKFISKHSKKLINNRFLLEKECLFMDQEMRHAKAHCALNSFLAENQVIHTDFHPRVYSFMYGVHKIYYEPMMIGAKKGNIGQIKKALFEVAVFESKNCISSFVFFESLFDNNNINNTIKLSQNLSILYLLGYHFIEEIEHCDVALDIYTEITNENVWTEKSIENYVYQTPHATLESYNAAFYCANFLNRSINLKDLERCPFSILTKNAQVEFITDNFHPNQASIKDKREYYIQKWDVYWEPLLKEEICKRHNLVNI
ncbi:unnamed protein product [Commensalibacter communis]|uniref:metal-dependent hydrolase n=1 Tax=Commensalibacter communis TaxID=2972786 RepID=UPI0022FFB479|nr:metal-dependent hydrolase [Commensalibacter communis]CAI3954149.1 unnamed protein product [Commensalibacter communis]CAI3954936.1 unnamed protein product [Commensalibacter communis]